MIHQTLATTKFPKARWWKIRPGWNSSISFVSFALFLYLLFFFFFFFIYFQWLPQAFIFLSLLCSSPLPPFLLLLLFHLLSASNSVFFCLYSYIPTFFLLFHLLLAIHSRFFSLSLFLNTFLSFIFHLLSAIHSGFCFLCLYS